MRKLVDMIPIRMKQYPIEESNIDWMRTGPVFYGHVFAHSPPHLWTLANQRQCIFNNWNAPLTKDIVNAGRTAGAIAVDFGLTSNKMSGPAMENFNQNWGLHSYLVESGWKEPGRGEL